MRIAMLLHAFPARSETFIARQIFGLAERGHELLVIAHGGEHGVPQPEGTGAIIVHHLPPAPLSGSRWRRTMTRATAAMGALVADPVGATQAMFLQAPSSLGEAATRLQRLPELRRIPPPDIVHCHYGDVGLTYRFLARLWSVPLVVSFYGYDCSSLPRAYGRAMYAPLFDAAGSVVVLGEAMRERLLALGCPPGLLHVHRLGVDTARFAFRARAAAADRPTRLLTVARLVEKKGIEFGLRAVAEVLPSHPHLTYDIVGDGPLRESLRRMARKLGIESAVRFLGPRDETGVAEAMEAADLFLLPSVTAADGDEEGTPTALIEASSRGLPVLSTRHAGIPEVVLDGISGFLVPERDPAALADRLRELLDRPERWAALGWAGRRHIEDNFDTSVLAARMEAHYSDLLARRSVAAGGPV